MTTTHKAAPRAPRPDADPGVRLAVPGPRGTTTIILVDFEDVARIKAHRWRVENGGRVIVRYFVRGGRRGKRTLQRFLLGPYTGEITYLNGNRFDFRRGNLASLPGHIKHRTDARRRRSWRAIVAVDGREYSCGDWPSQWLAEQALKSARAILPELVGRGYAPNRIRFRLARACGVLVFAGDTEAP